MTRAKFTCNAVTKRKAWAGAPDNEGFVYDAEFSPVVSGSDENKAFWKASPGGSLKLTTIRADHFQPGQDYYVDFTPVETGTTKE